MKKDDIITSNGYETPCCKEDTPEWIDGDIGKYKGNDDNMYPIIISHNKTIGGMTIMNFNGEYSSYDWTEIHYCNKCNVEYQFINSSI